ncbi:hypothetical protein WA026_022568 [Henosepilachna vigintioctopunctata]|uniref:Uncharacterized protein n=1 Tax=Henosepilachna vigintioctopunctata TaxID=420089 RepID=A0AAW1VB33_9CUCU
MAPRGQCNSDRVKLPKVIRPPCFNPGARCWPCRSIEIIGGDLLRGCDCLKHNGLQDNCRRSECRGSCWCRSRPWASCRPSQFSNGRHLAYKALGMKLFTE